MTTQTDKINEIIHSHLGLGGSKITPESKDLRPEHMLNDDLGADSLDAIEMTMALEEEFDVEIPDDDLDKWATVGDVCAYVESVTA